MANNEILDDLDPAEKFNRDMKDILEADDTGDTDDVIETEDVSEDLEEESAEEPESGSGEDATDEDSEEPEEVQPVKRKPASKEQEKIVALKRELKEAKDKLNQKAATEKAASNLQKLETLEAKYKEQGYDDDSAKHWARQDFELQELKHELAISNFEARNRELFELFPEARENVSEIIQKMDATGFTAKQVCRALYAEETNPVKDRAKKAVSGTLERPKVNNSVSSATRTAGSVEGTILTQAQKTEKKNFVNMFPSLAGMSDKEFLEVSKQYGL